MNIKLGIMFCKKGTHAQRRNTYIGKIMIEMMI